MEGMNDWDIMTITIDHGSDTPFSKITLSGFVLNYLAVTDDEISFTPINHTGLIDKLEDILTQAKEGKLTKLIGG